MRLALFVRRELWNTRRDRKALREYLENEFRAHKELAEDDIAMIVNHPSDIANDTETIFSFVDELAKEDETRRATRGEGDFPVGNWVNSFETFEDIVQVLRFDLKIQNNLAHIALSINLRYELLNNLKELLFRTGTDVKRITFWGTLARNSVIGGTDDTSNIRAEFLKWLGVFFVMSVHCNRLSTMFLDQALKSGELLQFNLDKNTLTRGRLLETLTLLRNEITTLRNRNLELESKDFIKLRAYYEGRDRKTDVRVKNLDLLMLFSVYDRIENVINITLSLLKAIQGDMSVLDNMTLNDAIVFPKDIAEESIKDVSLSETEEWLNQRTT